MKQFSVILRGSSQNHLNAINGSILNENSPQNAHIRQYAPPFSSNFRSTLSHYWRSRADKIFNGVLVTLMASALLSGCVSMSTPNQGTGSFHTEAVAQRQAQLEGIKSWNASGAISIQQAQQSPVIMRYDWQQMGSYNYRINLAASLNLGAVSIIGQPNRVTLQKGSEPPVSAPTAEALMKKSLGWSLPVPSLWYWARGLPAPGAAQVTKYDQYGHLTELQQNGWHVQYTGYQTVKGIDLPQTIELHRADITAKIVVKQWGIK